MPEQPDTQERPINHPPESLVEVLRRRLLGLEHEYEKLQDYARSLESGQQTLKEQLDSVRNELRRWQANRGVRLGRTLGLIGHNVQQSLAVTSGLVAHSLKHAIQANLDAPRPNTNVTGELAVSGWAIGGSPESLQIEVWLNDVRLGLADYGLERWDVVASQPWLNQVDCGFAGRFSLDSSKFEAGPATLKLRFSDGRSSSYDLTCPVIIAPDEASEHEKLYQDWIKRTEMRGWDFLAQRAASENLKYQPLISLLPQVGSNISPEHFAAFLDSVLEQTYRRWEIRLQIPPNTPRALLDTIENYAGQDSRIHLLDSQSQDLNDMLAECQSEYIAMPEAHSVLGQDALFQAVRFLNYYPDTDLLYSDEDFINEAGQRSQPQFKPDWSPELFYSRPYTGQLAFYRTQAVKKAGGFRPETGEVEAQSYDLILRLLEQGGQFFHLPAVIYHCRHSLDLQQPLSATIKQALQDHFERLGQAVIVESGFLPATTRYRYQILEQPAISIIIPTRDQSEVLRRCIDSILERTTYSNYEIVVVDNASHQSETQRYFEELSTNLRVKLLSFEGPFNYAAINNFAASQAESDLLVFLNNDTEVLTPGWLEELASFATIPEVGAAGARLLYPNDSVQHAGVVVGLLGVADHVMKGLPATAPGYLGLAKTVKNVSALTAACLMTRQKLFKEVGGFDEQNLPVAFNDVDYCLKLRERGLRLVWTPYAELYHHESLSRGMDFSIEKESRLHREITFMFSRWSGQIACDPYYNPNLSLDRLDYVVTERCSNSSSLLTPAPVTISEKTE